MIEDIEQLREMLAVGALNALALADNSSNNESEQRHRRDVLAFRALLEQLPPRQPAEPTTPGAVVCIGDDEDRDDEWRWFQLRADDPDQNRAQWYTFASAYPVLWTDIVEGANNAGKTIRVIGVESTGSVEDRRAAALDSDH